MIVGVALLFVISALMLTQASQRHLPVVGWVWTGELARYALVWLTFSLAGYLVGRDEHITLKLADFLPWAGVKRTIWILSNLVVAAVCLTFTVEAAELVLSASPQTTPALGIPVSWTYAIPMAGLALAALRAVANAFLPGSPDPDALPAEGADPEEPIR
ncbi:TRAP-type C4-dicarboxylate transport system permease small subunit [Spinactinospora alkalitolerans]|uniref:TRAP-type C4-dicarboxylate transport system permease small subunit n=1 Tax=Spinactinospora alkalitolerans TaxID=687207 RepID=A0A852U7T1_9ACTN|nr:TRAP transporter small permease subunit [Spinactinospora alkalitolerans]NYE50124.1 TRAP-type C4-dicarboxylate transport system permease small subunit [Spinactinospora alkalitolerans]